MDQSQVIPNNLGILARLNQYWKARRITPWLLFFFLIYIIATIKLVTIKEFDGNIIFGAYSVLVSFYILSRFGLSYFYTPKDLKFKEYDEYEPTVTFAVPAKNEGENIRETILRIAASNYPKHKMDIITINDGSTDNTLEEMYAASKEAEEMGVEVEVVNWTKNKGKREGMAECVRLSKKDIIIFIDSDSFVEENAAREVVKYFSIPSIGAVAGHAYVANAETNILTKMQAVRYYVAFKAYKAAEALFGTVTCCSGCCSAYRREYLMKFLEAWARQKFLGVQCTYGDDRSLTNYMLYHGYDTVYAPEVVSYTVVPDNYRQFMKQQLRWKKSWIRESLLASVFVWKRNIFMSISFYLGVILPLLAPLIVFRSLIWLPLTDDRWPFFYIGGLMLMAMTYGLYYYIHTNDRKWIYGVVFATFYTLVLIWQLPYAMLTLRDSRWGTR